MNLKKRNVDPVKVIHIPIFCFHTCSEHVPWSVICNRITCYRHFHSEIFESNFLKITTAKESGPKGIEEIWGVVLSFICLKRAMVSFDLKTENMFEVCKLHKQRIRKHTVWRNSRNHRFECRGWTLEHWSGTSDVGLPVSSNHWSATFSQRHPRQMLCFLLYVEYKFKFTWEYVLSLIYIWLYQYKEM